MVSITERPFPIATGEFAKRLDQEFKEMESTPKEETFFYQMAQQARIRRHEALESSSYHS